MAGPGPSALSPDGVRMGVGTQPRQGERPPGKGELVFVVSEHVGHIGGGAKAPMLLCEALRELGYEVVLFALAAPETQAAERLCRVGVRVQRALVRSGHRFDWPRRALALQVWLAAWLHEPGAICLFSLSRLTSHVLGYPLRAPAYAWECTEALPGTKFVDESVGARLGRVRAVWAPSRTIERNLRGTYGYRGPVRIVPFWAEDASVTSPDRPRSAHFLFMGRFDRDKGLDLLCAAFERVLERFPAARLTLCGSGDAAWVRQIARHPAITLRVALIGADFEAAFYACDALVLPSLHEGYPLSLLEACARGKPVIATRVGSVPEVFEASEAAMLVPVGSVEALSSAMIQLLAEADEVYGNRCRAARELFCRVSAPSVVLSHLAEALAPLR